MTETAASAAVSATGEQSALDALESEAIHIIREVVAEFDRPAMLFSGGKDSVVMLHLAAKAFWPAAIPFPVLHVDTGHNFPEVLEFRDRTVERLKIRLEVAKVQDYIDDGRLLERGLQVLPGEAGGDHLGRHAVLIHDDAGLACHAPRELCWLRDRELEHMAVVVQRDDLVHVRALLFSTV